MGRFVYKNLESNGTILPSSLFEGESDQAKLNKENLIGWNRFYNFMDVTHALN